MSLEEEFNDFLPAVFSNIDWEEFEMLAGIGYTPEMIAKYFRIDVALFLTYFIQEGSELKERYDTGMLQQQAKEGMAVLQSVQGGNVTQAQRLDKIRKAMNFEEHKRRIIYGE